MGLTFVLGRAGSGKTSHMIEEMLEDQRGSSLYLVPEQFTLGAEKEILTRTPATTIKVLSFTRLAYRVFSRVGIKRHTLLDDVSKAMLIRKIVRGLEGELSHKITGNQGFIEKIASTLTELSRQQITPEALIPLTERGDGLAIKTKDLLKIYQAYQGYIKDQYLSSEEVLDLLATQIGAGDSLKGVKVYIDGFDSFTKQEYRVIEALMKQGSVTVGLTLSFSDTQTFNETLHTYHQIKNLAGGTQAQVLHLEQNLRHRVPELVFLEQQLFHQGTPYGNAAEAIEVVSCSNNHQEVVETAAAIRRLVQTKGYHYKDVAVLAPEGYHGMIHHLFRVYDIPYFLDETAGITHHPMTTTVLSILEVLAYGWKNEHIFALLRAGLMGVSDEEIDALENYTFAYGINGKKKWGSAQWRYEPPTETDPLSEKEKRINTIKDQVVNCLTAFEACFGKKQQVRQSAIQFFEAMATTGLIQRIEAFINEAGLTAGDHLQVWRLVTGTFETMVSFLGEAPMGVREYLQTYQVGIESVSMGRVPPKLDGVTIASFGRSRLGKIKALFVVGSQDMTYPTRSMFYTDKEIKQLNDYGFSLPTEENEISKENFAWYSMLTQPSDYLYLTHGKASLTGKIKEKSQVVTELETLFVEASRPPNQQENKQTALKKLAEDLQNYFETGKIEEESLYLYKWYEQAGYPVKKMGQIASGEKQAYLTAGSLRNLYPEPEINASVSRLEKYQACPFSYFAQYQLGLEKRKVMEIQPLDVGNVLHDVLEAFIKNMSQQQMQTLTKEQIRTHTQGYIRQATQKQQFLFESPSGKFALERITSIAATSLWALCRHMVTGTFNIYGTEVGFGEHGPITSIVIEINDEKKFVLKGKVDRVDVLDAQGNTYVKVIDYKSGNKRFDVEDIYHGMQMQLVIYLNAIIQSGQAYFRTATEVLPGGVFYFRMKDPIVPASDPGEAESKILDAFKMSGVVLDEQVVKNAMGADGANISKEALDLTAFNGLIETAVEQVKTIGQRMLSGYIAPEPMKRNQETPCTYCEYAAVCQIKER